MNPLVGGLLNIHKIISQGLIVSIRKCDEYHAKQSIPVEEAVGFSIYVTSLKWVTHSHHLSEDEIAFPFFKEHLEAPYDRLSDDHIVMASILDELDKSLLEIPSGGVGKLREVLGKFEKLWAPHIRTEEENFTTEKLGKVVGMKEQIILAKKLGRHGSKNSGPGPHALPFMIYNLEGSDREAFIKYLPWIVKKVLVPIIWKGQWKSMKPFLQ